MTRNQWIVGGVVALVAVAIAWVFMTALGRFLQTAEPPEVTETPAQPSGPAPPAAVPRIKATLFFASEDGRMLVPVEQEIPLAEGTVAQARALVQAQLETSPPPPLTSTIPEGTKLRGVYLSARKEAFVDLDAAVREKFPGGSMNELFVVYTIVNAITTNLPDVEQVQLLIDGREVDSLAGHVDLRRPLRKNEALIAKAEQ